MQDEGEVCRAVLCVDAYGMPVVLATDSQEIADDVEIGGCGSSACEFGLVDEGEVGFGPRLWAGTFRYRATGMKFRGELQFDKEYVGELTPITDMGEFLSLLRMTPPKREDGEGE